MLKPRAGNIKDSVFITTCLLSGARKGLFAVNADSAECVKRLKAEVRMILFSHRLSENVPLQTLVYSARRKPVGFAMVAGRSEADLELELYAIAVAEKYQRQGYGAKILDDVLTNFKYMRFYARCSKSSVTMQQMLERRSFQQIGTNELGYSIMVYDQSAVAGAACG